MKIQFIKSIADIPWEERNPIALEKHRGKTARVTNSKGEHSLIIVLPCGHHSDIFGWDITDIDTDQPSANPSIFCQGTENKPCWHGYLTKGELVSV